MLEEFGFGAGGKYLVKIEEQDMLWWPPVEKLIISAKKPAPVKLGGHTGARLGEAAIRTRRFAPDGTFSRWLRMECG